MSACNVTQPYYPYGIVWHLTCTNAQKNVRKISDMKIATHSGTYHLDDVMAGAILSNIFGVDHIIRTRDPAVLADAQIVFDVGGGQYDHHFVGAEKRSNGITYSSCGLVWRDFGIRYLKIMNVKQDIINDVWAEWDKIMTEIDAHDNGEGSHENSELFIASMIQNLNGHKPYQFAVSFMREYINAKTFKIIQVQNDRKDLKAVVDTDPGYIIELPREMIWQELIHEMAPDAKFVIYPRENQWRIFSVPVSPGSFESKISLLPSLCGLRSDDLYAKSGLDLIFVHATGFTGAGKSRHDVLELAKRSMSANLDMKDAA
jgi:uncharacterized UPF0160 family protein